MSTYVLTNKYRVKDILGISSTTYDTRIEMFIPMVTDDILHYTKNYFVHSTAYFHDNDWTLSTGGSITKDSTEDMFTEQFISGDTIRISGSKFNDDYYTIASISSSEIVVNESLNAESTDSFITIVRTEFPSDLEGIASNMIGHKIYAQASINQGVNSESIGDYSITYKSGGNNYYNGYPIELIKSLTKYRKARFS